MNVVKMATGLKGKKIMKWIRYRSMCSSGYNKWEYIELPSYISIRDNDAVIDFIEDRDDVPTWSEHYRRVEWKSVKSLPKKIIERRIESAKSNIEHYQRIIDELKKMTPAKTDPNEIERKRKVKKMNNRWKKLGRLDMIEEIK